MKEDVLYVVHMLECIERYAAGGRDAFFGSTLVQDAVIRNFEVIGEAAKRLSDEFTRAHTEVPWRRLAGFRDVLMHQYMGVDVGEVWNAIERDLAGLKGVIEEARMELEEHR